MARIAPLVAVAIISILIAHGMAQHRSFERNTPEQVFRQGCELYQEGDFVGAGKCFQAMVEKGVRNANVYFNLGNAYLKNGEVGKAIACYRRAEFLSPRDKDIKTNLEIARASITIDDQTIGNPSSSRSLTVLLSPGESTGLAYIFAYLVAFVVVAACFVKKSIRMVLLKIMVVLTICLVFFSSVTIYKMSEVKHNDYGVLIGSTPIMAGPGAAFEDIGRLSQGMEVKILSESGLWLEVRLANGIVGWVPKESVERVWEGFLM